MTPIMIFSVLVSGRPVSGCYENWWAYDLPSDARASLTSSEMLSSSLRLNKGFRLFNFSKVPPGSA